MEWIINYSKPPFLPVSQRTGRIEWLCCITLLIEASVCVWFATEHEKRGFVPNSHCHNCNREKRRTQANIGKRRSIKRWIRNEYVAWESIVPMIYWRTQQRSVWTRRSVWRRCIPIPFVPTASHHLHLQKTIMLYVWFERASRAKKRENERAPFWDGTKFHHNSTTDRYVDEVS